MKNHLRFGIMCRGTQFAAWEADCIRQLMQEAEPALLIIDAGPKEADTRPQRRRGLLGKLDSLRRPEMAWTLFQRWIVNRRSQAMRKVDLQQELGGVPAISCQTLSRGKFSRYLQADDVAAVREHNLDFIIRFAFDIIRGDVLQVPRFGVWSFHHDDIEKYRGGPPCFWEMVRGDPVTAATLQKINDRLDGGVILRRGWFRTAFTSYRLNRDTVYLGATGWPAQVCRDIRNGTADYLHGEPTRSTAPIDYRPSRWRLFRFSIACACHYAAAQMRRLTQADDWAVGIAETPIGEFIGDSRSSDVRWITADGGRARYIADPIPDCSDPQKIFVETYDYRDGVGRLLAYDAATGAPTESPVPTSDVHLSYPFSFQFQGETYCMPEAAAAQQLQLWKRAASGDWVPDVVLLDLPVLDPTIVEHQGMWWLFGTVGGDHPDVKLRLWSATEPLGPWTEHPQSPVKFDVRSSRPAGPIFVSEGGLYRPAQNCARTYGGSLTINRIQTLTPSRFEEETVCEVHADPRSPWPHGIHTIAPLGQGVVFDAKRQVFIPASAIRELRKLFRRLWKPSSQPASPDAENSTGSAEGPQRKAYEVAATANDKSPCSADADTHVESVR